MRVVLAIGGSVLAPDLDPERVAAHASAIQKLVDAGCTVGAVVGGGTAARSYISAARDLGANEIALDNIGIGVTRLNARLLIAALGERAAPRPVEAYDEADMTLRRDDVAVMGGVVAGQTTDAVGAGLAESVDADLLVYATSVSGVFSADPQGDGGAEKYDRLSATELVDVIGGIEMHAGASAPVDLLAAKLIERSGVRGIVLDGTEPQNVVDAVLDGDHDGTDIVPAGESDDLPWWP